MDVCPSPPPFVFNFILFGIYEPRNISLPPPPPPITLLLSFGFQMIVSCCNVYGVTNLAYEVSSLYGYETHSGNITTLLGKSVTTQITFVLSNLDHGLQCTEVSKFNSALMVYCLS